MPTLNDATAVHVGATPAQAVYLGDTKVWPAAAAPPLVQAILDLGAVVCWYDNKEWASATEWTLIPLYVDRFPFQRAPEPFFTVPMWNKGFDPYTLETVLPQPVPVPYTLLGVSQEGYIYSKPWVEVDEAIRVRWSPPDAGSHVNGWLDNAWPEIAAVESVWAHTENTQGYAPLFHAFVAEADGRGSFYNFSGGSQEVDSHTVTLSAPGALPLPAGRIGTTPDAETGSTRRGLLAVVPSALSAAQIETLWTILQGTPP